MNNTINTLTKTHTLINDFLPVKQMQTNEVKLKIFFCLLKKKQMNDKPNHNFKNENVFFSVL